MRNVRIAAVCMHSLPGAIEANLEKTERCLREAVSRGAEIVCFPECSLTGYDLRDPMGISPPSKTSVLLDHVARMGRRHGVGLLVGMVEWRAGEGPFISQVLAGPEGVAGIYRKTHLSPQEGALYRAGESLDVLPLAGATLGVSLCYEAHFPEIATILALKGMEILFLPHASPRGEPREKLSSWQRHLTARAFDNGVFVVACNQVGEGGRGLTFPGVALVLDPAGREISRYEGREEGILIADLKARDLREIRGHRMRYFLPNRRPGLYRDLLGKPA